jgi:hypothetical protein
MEKLKPYQKYMMSNIYKKMNIKLTNTDTLKHMDKIYSYIVNNFAVSSQRDRLIVFNIILKNLGQSKAGDFVYKKAVELNKQFENTEYKQRLDENELKNYVKYEDLLLKVDELIDTYNKDPNKKNIINVLLLSLYVLHEPLRNDYADMKIIYYDEDDDRINNFILKTDTSYYIIINNDKVKNLYGRGEFIITNPILKSILDIYFNIFASNNTYLFEKSQNVPYTKRMIQYKINQYFKDDDKVLNICNLRSSFITNFYKNNLDILSRDELATKCRHSREMAEKSYCKYFI